MAPICEGIAESTVSQNQTNPVIATVVEVLPNAILRVKTEYGAEVLAHFSAEARSELVRVLPGDRVRLEISPYHKGRGRIVGKA
ncbi:MAG: translation initiation factor IF-1 [Candidatus Eremiobacteraeota bacterium]|nr:translation initiation factor IF-1 [Candidatus Eremiobacteraeota bacterium]